LVIHLTTHTSHTHTTNVHRRTHGTSKRVHDAPDTQEAFHRLRYLSEGPEKGRLLQELASAWLPMAHRIAWGYRDRGESLEDLRQVAALGLSKALTRYDPTLGNAFQTYSIPIIKGELRRHFRDYTWAVHVPRRVKELRNHVRDARRQLAADPDSAPPTPATIAAFSGLTQDEVREGTGAQETYSALSLDASSPSSEGESGTPLQELLGEQDPSLDLVIERESIKPYLAGLPVREKRILYMRYFQDMTQSMIAEELGISQMHVSRLITRTCARLRREAMAPVP
jgi:RNA polymerase sigma-B factor